jgi:hypothetical protein
MPSEVDDGDDYPHDRPLADRAPKAGWGSLVKCNMQEIVLGGAASENQFKTIMRLDLATFDALDRELAPTEAFRYRYDLEGKAIDTGRRGPKLKSTRQLEIAVGLYAMSSLENYARISTIWGLSDSNVVSNYVRRFVSAVLSLEDKYIKWPTGDRLQAVMNGFEHISGLKGCIGALDGCHIEIQAPAKDEHPGEYNSYKKRYSMVLQALVDCDGLFIHASAGWPGSVGDLTIFGRSTLPAKLDEVCEPYGNDPRVPRFVLGDGGYSLRSNVLVGFEYDTSDPRERIFNNCVDTGRVVVENAFGRLKGRWRCARPTRALVACTCSRDAPARRVLIACLRRLKYVSNKNLAETAKQIQACCILHNFVQLSEREAMGAAPLSRRSGDHASPAAFDDDDAMPEVNDDEDPRPGDETLAQARAYRDGIVQECVLERQSRFAAAFDARTGRAASIRHALRTAERADRS